MKVANTITLTLLTLCAIGVFFLFRLTTSSSPSECHANIRAYINTPKGGVYENININIVFDDGFYSVIGTIKDKDNSYILHRESHFSKDGGNNSETFKIKEETRFFDDNVPEELWEKVLLPRPYNTPFYFSRSIPKSNLTLYSSLSNPLFICATSE